MLNNDLTNAVKLHGMVPTYVSIVIFFIQSTRNIFRWPLCQVVGLESQVFGFDSCGLHYVAMLDAEL